MSITVEPPVRDEPIEPVQVLEEPRAIATAPVGRDRSRWRRRVAWTLLGFGIFVLGFILFLFALSPLIATRRQVVLAAQLQTLTDAGPATETTWRPVAGDPVAVIEIPRIGVHAVVIEGTTPQELMAGPGHFSVSPLPGSPGNVVIMGRRSTFGGPFGSIGLLHKGDTITVSSGIGAFTYSIRSVESVPSGALDVIGSTEDNQLTLVTAASGIAPDGRTAVIARLDGDPVDLPPAPTNVTTAAETGIAGDPRGIGGLLLWGELLIAAIVAATLLRRRVPGTVVWLLGLPIILALLWATYLALAQVLPATV